MIDRCSFRIFLALFCLIASRGRGAEIQNSEVDSQVWAAEVIAAEVNAAKAKLASPTEESARGLDAEPATYSPQPFRVIPSVASTYVTYTQDGVADYYEMTVGVKLSVQGSLWSEYRLEYGADANIDVLPLKQTRDIAARFLWANLHAGYQLPELHPSLTLTVYAGISFSSSFVSNDAFGYKNVSFVQFQPTARWKFGEDNFAKLYVKFAPLGDKFFSFDWQQRLISMGIGYEHALGENQALMASLDANLLKLVLQGTHVQTRSLTLNLGYAF
jgi:hypothetical protein